MKLTGMATAFEDILLNHPSSELSFSEKMSMMVDREEDERESRRLARLLRAAKLKRDACVEDVWCDPSRGLEKSVMRDMARCEWVRNKQNVLIVGKTGCGKSYVAAALAQAACRKGYRVLYTRVPRLLQDLAIARADGSYRSTLARLEKLSVLILDDFLITPLNAQERADLLEVLEDRYDHSSTVIATQMPTKNWHELLADPTIADAICDRVIHNAHLVKLKGPSMRQRKGLELETKPAP